MKLSIIIPVYKTKKMLLSHLACNYPYLTSHQIIIVDDASRDGLVDEIKNQYPDIEIIENDTNLGFSKTINKGIQKARGDLIFCLNSDVKLFDKSFEEVCDLFARDETLFGVSFAQIEKNEEIVGKNRIFFKRGFIFHEKSKDLSAGLNAWAEGGASIIRKSYLDELGAFDELYSPFYWEDIDLSYRAYKRGWKVLFTPNVKVQHHHESTIGTYYDKSHVAKIAFRNHFIFMWKNITTPSLFFTHLTMLPFHLYCFIIKGRYEAIFGFCAAFLKLGEILKRREWEKNHQKLRDDEVLALFKTSV